jgi:2-keto-3-deoxy-L-rhamnonate aldolase RhmA
MADRLHELLKRHDLLYGVICRDPTLVDIELMAQIGYHIVWIDLEHSPLSLTEAARLCRTIEHLGMVPLVRIAELRRGDVQTLVEAGFRIIALANIGNASEARQLVSLCKFPPLGERGVSTCSAATGYSLGSDVQQTLARANDATHLMVLFEDEQGMSQLDQILQVEGIDLVSVGPNDWAVSLGAFDDASKARLSDRIDRVLTAAAGTGKITAMGVSSPAEGKRFVELGVRLLFVGVDINLNPTSAVSGLQWPWR